MKISKFGASKMLAKLTNSIFICENDKSFVSFVDKK